MAPSLPYHIGISSRNKNGSSAKAVTIVIAFCLVTFSAAAVDDPSTTSTASSATSTVAPTPANNGTTLLPPIVVTSRPLLGQNGTGQRWFTNASPKPTVVSEPISPGLMAEAVTSTKSPVTNTSSVPSSPATTPVPRGTPGIPIPPATKFDPPGVSSWEDEYLNVDNVDTENAQLTEEQLRQKNLTLGVEQHHQYYNSTTLHNTETVQEYLRSFRNLTPNSILSKSHRRAMTVRLKFQFPFYGHLIENITVATGGFIYTGDYVHSWLAATQFIAPLMANFDTSLSNDSFVKYYDNGTAFTVLWENVQLHNLPKKGGFTFSTTLHKNGDIVFGYYEIPMAIDSIEDKKHPVKVGLSDAYISDKTVFYTRRKTIFEYHRVTFGSPITSNTLIILKPEATCNTMETCADCTNLKTFECGWCPTLGRCSSGTDRKRDEWLLKGCDKAQAVSEDECASVEVPVRKTKQSGATVPLQPSSRNSERTDEDSDEDVEGGGVGTVMGVLIPFGLVFLAVGWLMYAYRNPHTKSGQLLIQFRPSQWSWRRGEARYTAATIHM